MIDDVISVLLREMLSEWSAVSPAARSEAIEQLHRLTDDVNPDDGTTTTDQQVAVVALLTRLIDQIADPRHWTTHAFARDENGQEVSWNSAAATR